MAEKIKYKPHYQGDHHPHKYKDPLTVKKDAFWASVPGVKEVGKAIFGYISLVEKGEAALRRAGSKRRKKREDK